jgi:exosortase/archaeosortase family protein
MRRVVSDLSNKYPFVFFAGKFVLIYASFTILFQAYVGLLDPKGDYFWPVLTHIDLIQFILDLLKYPVGWLLQLIGYNTRMYLTGVGILHGPGAHIAFPCLGIGIMITYTSLILAYPGKNKLLYLISGILLVHVLNIFRIFSVILIQLSSRNSFDTAHTVFNLLAYSGILLLFYRYTRNVKSIV